MGNGGTDNVAFRVNSPQVISEVIDGELVMIDLERGTYYSAEGSGAFIWELIEAGHSLAEILHTAHRMFSGDPGVIESGIRSFVERLLAEELAFPVDGVAAPNLEHVGPSVSNGAEFVPPVLNVYADMADILLLDPVHDVDETGWPKPKNDRS